MHGSTCCQRGGVVTTSQVKGYYIMHTDNMVVHAVKNSGVKIASQVKGGTVSTYVNKAW